MWVSVWGLVGSVVSALIWLPQARTVWRTRNDVVQRASSLGTLIVAAINCLVWIVYSLVSGTFWPGLPCWLSLATVTWSAVMVLRARRRPWPMLTTVACLLAVTMLLTVAAVLLSPAMASWWFGLAGAVSSAVAWFPQAIRTWQIRRDVVAVAQGVSLATCALQMTNAAVWMLYAAAARTVWPAIPGFFTLPLVVFVACRTMAARRAATSRSASSLIENRR